MKSNTLFLIIALIASSSFAMDKSWIGAYVASEKYIKEEQEKKTARNLQEIAQKIKIEADITKRKENATEELITTLRAIPTHRGYRTDIPEGQSAIKEAQQAEAIATQKISDLLKEGASPNKLFYVNRRSKKYGTDTSPLIYALALDFSPIARLLIEAGSDVNFTDRHNYNPLMLAMRSEVFGIAQLLLERGANPNVPIQSDPHAESPIVIAVRRGNYALIRLLIAKKANPLWNFNDAYDLAVSLNDIQALTLLFANPMIKNVIKSKALYTAVLENNFGIVTLLLAHGAHPQLEQSTYDYQYNTLDPRHILVETPLQLALRTPASPNIINALKNSPLHAWSAEEIHIANEKLKKIMTENYHYGNRLLRKIKFLLLSGANPNISVDAQRYGIPYKQSLIKYAIDKKLPALVRYLLDLGVNPNHIDLRTLLQEAINLDPFECNDIVKILLDYGADPDLVSYCEAKPPLLLAHDARVVKMLLDAGANPNNIRTTDANGVTPLHNVLRPDFFIACAPLGRIHLLLQAGADPLIADNTGHTALSYAQIRLDRESNENERAGYLQIIEMLTNPQNIRRSGLQKLA